MNHYRTSDPSMKSLIEDLTRKPTEDLKISVKAGKPFFVFRDRWLDSILYFLMFQSFTISRIIIKPVIFQVISITIRLKPNHEVKILTIELFIFWKSLAFTFTNH